jgi:hypothetical protein
MASKNLKCCHYGTLSIRNFTLITKKTLEFQFWAIVLDWPTAMFRPKSQNIIRFSIVTQNSSWWYSIVQENSKNLYFEHLRYIGLYGHGPAKVPKFQYRAWWYSIDWQFHTDDQNLIPLWIFDYSCPVTGQQPKNVLQISVTTRSLGIQYSILNQDPLLRKYAFLSITWVTAPSKGLNTRNVFCIRLMVICAFGLLPNPAKVPNFQYI